MMNPHSVLAMTGHEPETENKTLEEILAQGILMRYAVGSDVTRLTQGVMARARTVRKIDPVIRSKKIKKNPHYCLTEGVFIKGMEDLSADLLAAIESGRITEEDLRKYHEHYWIRALDRDNERSPILRIDNPLQIMYPTNNGDLPRHLGGGNMNHIFSSLTENWDEVLGTFAAMQAAIETTLESSGLGIISNHATWMNLPAIAAALQQQLGIAAKDIYIAVGPSLTISEQNLTIARSQGNVIKFIPPTLHGKLPQGLESLEGTINKEGNKFLKATLGTPGKVVIMCPMGTTDTLNQDTGKFEIDISNGGALTALRFMNGYGPVMAVGTNDSAIFNGSKLPRRGKSFVALQPIVGKGALGRDRDALEAVYGDLAGSVLNEAGENIGLLKTKALHVVGTGNFGRAQTTALSRNTANSVFRVTNLSRAEAALCLERKSFGEIIMLAVPSAEKEAIKRYIAETPNSTIILTSKGPAAREVYAELDEETKKRVVVLSGPNVASQIAKGDPSAAVLAGSNSELLDYLHEELNGPSFRLYKSLSPNVVQLSGVLKNLIVLELGKVWWTINDPEQKTKLLMQALRAAYSVVEEQAPGNENPEEFWGIAGLGDILLCLEFFKGSEGSRNFKYGEGLGCCCDSEALKEELGTVEGAPTSEGWHDESLGWLKTPEMEAFKKVITQETPPEELVGVENADHMSVFTRAFTALEAACEQMQLNENTRAWAFCRLHKEMQRLFPGDSKNEILHAMCKAVLAEAKSEEATPFCLPEEAEKESLPILAGLEALTNRAVSVEDLRAKLLKRDTPTEGFEKTEANSSRTDTGLKHYTGLFAAAGDLE